eukprot:CAMPEP_0195146650 /NCGR_PEP_ID=MMETSP0448-20130528/171981_1 /TAXON_ID=66468 /ORGANISM="Heterocapsa triquestra, Strain CCMP 448" /LENGTH=48 /DNA_ID= /DNA_START= /DNA_END= /DNA_ORIENTATION=
MGPSGWPEQTAVSGAGTVMRHVKGCFTHGVSWHGMSERPQMAWLCVKT